MAITLEHLLLLKEICYGSAESLRQAFSMGTTDINIVTPVANTFLLEAIYLQDLSKVEMLLEIGANPDLVCHGKVPLIEAVLLGEQEIVKALLYCQADPNQKDHKGRTALCFVTSCGDFKQVELLLFYGSDYEIVTEKGNNLLHYAAKNTQETVNFFLRFDLDLNLRNKKGETPLVVANRYGNWEGGSLLIENGAV